MRGDKVYIADDSLRILDVSDPTLPYELNNSGYVAGYMLGLTIEEDIAYTTSIRDGGLHLMDISNPADMRDIGFYRVPRRRSV